MLQIVIKYTDILQYVPPSSYNELLILEKLHKAHLKFHVGPYQTNMGQT
jgi:hypothetical protein